MQLPGELFGYTSSMKPNSYRLLVVAHPDDETIFFAGAILSKRDLPWHLICLTDGNGDGRGKTRHRELLAAAKHLGIKKIEHWEYADIYDSRLPVDEIAERLSNLPAPKEVFSHGPMGEYGHPHHQDASLATHRAFADRIKVFSPAWNCHADFVVMLSAKQFRKKTHAFAKIYSKETSRFLNLIPNMPSEGYRRFRLREVEATTGFLRREQKLSPRKMGELEWTAPMLPLLRKRMESRLF